MSNETLVVEPQPELQRPDAGIESVTPADPIMITDDQYPWLNAKKVEVPTVGVKLADSEESFRYGSVVDGNSAVEKIARDVSPQNSVLAERCMFRGLPMLFRGERTTIVESVGYTASSVPVYKTTNMGADAPRLFFSVGRDDSGSPVVLKLGIASHKKQQRLVGILSGDSRRRQKKDG